VEFVNSFILFISKGRVVDGFRKREREREKGKRKKLEKKKKIN